jgi:RNA polymerase sigma factor (sigma-70 family)
MSQPISDIFALIRACEDGDATARYQFQDEYGEDIYYFPVKLYGLPLDEAGDFYVYVFDKDRIFTRLRTFQGRANIKFRTFLSFFVLKSLFFDWLRTVKEPDMSSPLDPDTKAEEPSSPETPVAPDLWNCLTSEEQLDLKLLCLIEYDLSLDDIRLLATISGRSLRDTLLLVEEVQHGLRRKDEKFTQLNDILASTWGWILVKQKELQEIDEKLRHLMPDSEAFTVLLARKEDLEASLQRRYRQRDKLVREIRTYKMTTPYKEIARLLNTTVGTVCSRIFRLRERLGEEMGERRVRGERTS